ncbi:MAG: signal peptidase I [Nocardioides sp.]
MTSERSDGSVQAESESPKKLLPLWQETILLLAVALGLAILIKALLVQAFYIPSESMEPGLVNNDRILVEKVSYWFGGTPQRGDVVVFKDPGGWLSGSEAVGTPNAVTGLMAKIGLYPSGGHLVKRVIGVAGDTIHCCDPEGRIVVNSVPLDEQGYAREDGQPCYGPMISTCDWTAGPVPEGSIFVMGDNRAHSADSTVHMCQPTETDCVPGDEYVPVDLVVGKVFVLLWPRSHFGWLHRPDTFADVHDTAP